MAMMGYIVAKNSILQRRRQMGRAWNLLCVLGASIFLMRKSLSKH